MKRFFKNLFLHPGTWFLSSLALVGIGMAFPPAAPVLVAVAAGCLTVGGIATIPYVKGFFDRIKTYGLDLTIHLSNWRKHHPFQVLAVAIGLGLFVTALVLTIGFFTGGAGFAFMGPVFAALSAPFVAANAAAGISLFVPALAGFAFVMAPLTLGNNLKRFLGWLDSFTRDGVAANAIKRDKSYHLTVTQDWKRHRLGYTENLIKGNPIEYLKLFGKGVSATILPLENKGWFTSPDAELQEKGSKAPTF